MSLIDDVTHQYTNTTQKTLHKTTQTPHKTCPGKGLQSLIPLYISCYIEKHREEGRQDAIRNGTNQAGQKTQRGEWGHENLYTVDKK